MKVTATALPGVCLIEPIVFADQRGWFVEAFNSQRYVAIGLTAPFVQDNISASRQGILRGLHVQHPHAQGKLVQVIRGEVFDVAVDVRTGSPTFGRWVGEYLSAENMRQLYVPPGFAHGFLVTSDEALFSYKCTDYYHPEAEQSILWNDPAIGICWPLEHIGAVELSPRDRAAATLHTVAPDLLPAFTS